MSVNYVKPEDASFRGLWQRHFDDARRERAFLSAVGFNTGFLACRGITHAIRDGVGPFHNMSAGGRHLHHSTFGIFGLIGIGCLWTYRLGTGDMGEHPFPSRTTATLYGVSSALTLDEFALWFDLSDDYWNKAGRKSIDAVVLFWGISAIGLTSRGLAAEARGALRDLEGRRAQ
jgi:hypothetical protein